MSSYVRVYLVIIPIYIRSYSYTCHKEQTYTNFTNTHMCDSNRNLQKKKINDGEEEELGEEEAGNQTKSVVV